MERKNFLKANSSPLELQTAPGQRSPQSNWEESGRSEATKLKLRFWYPGARPLLSIPLRDKPVCQINNEIICKAKRGPAAQPEKIMPGIISLSAARLRRQVPTVLREK